MAINFLNSIIDAINSIPVDAIISYGQIIGVLISIFCMVGMVIVGKKMEALYRPGSKNIIEKAKEENIFVKIPKEKTVKVWKDILAKIHSMNASDWLLAVIHADALMDDILKGMGLPGETMADRLKSLDVSKLKSLDDVWEAHKIRNKVAHSPATLLRHDELLRAINLYKKALKELEFID